MHMEYVIVSEPSSPIKGYKSKTSESYDVLSKVEPFENDQKLSWKAASDIRDSIIATQQKLLDFYADEFGSQKPHPITVTLSYYHNC